MSAELLRAIRSAVNPLPQTQESLTDQLVALNLAAVTLGLYDASDWLIAHHVHEETEAKN